MSILVVASHGFLCDTQANADESYVMSSHEGGDVFTLIHHELNICTNSVSLSRSHFEIILIVKY